LDLGGVNKMNELKSLLKSLERELEDLNKDRKKSPTKMRIWKHRFVKGWDRYKGETYSWKEPGKNEIKGAKLTLEYLIIKIKLYIEKRKEEEE
jgi:hypothetical protein